MEKIIMWRNLTYKPPQLPSSYSYRRLTGASGYMETLFKSPVPNDDAPVPPKKDWHIAFIVGANMSATIYIQATGGLQMRALPSYFFALAGVFVGFGTRMGCGCTSGHGISGLSRISIRSFAAVCTFMATSIITANLLYNSAFENAYESDFPSSEWYVTRIDMFGWLSLYMV